MLSLTHIQPMPMNGHGVGIECYCVRLDMSSAVYGAELVMCFANQGLDLAVSVLGIGLGGDRHDLDMG
jgi:hypothetical protein